jgi:hypothetical protein
MYTVVLTTKVVGALVMTYVKPLLKGAMDVFWDMYWLYTTGCASTVASGKTGQAPVGPSATVDCADVRKMREKMDAMIFAGAATRVGAMVGELGCCGRRGPKCAVVSYKGRMISKYAR